MKPPDAIPHPAFGAPLPAGGERGKGVRVRGFRGRCPRLLMSSPYGAERSGGVRGSWAAFSNLSSAGRF
ncbi:hypothetical protein SBA2_670023 [Acidobacteriia bacterium SbA2]|nr:hypothetical protein SBA2_670023 [Acidobacteriia bacterium SbA2]